MLLVLGLMGCGGDSPETGVEVAADTSAGAASTLDLPVDVDVNLVEEICHRDDVVLVDVRERWEYEEQ